MNNNDELFSLFPTPVAKINISNNKAFISSCISLKNTINKGNDNNKNRSTHYFSDDTYVLNKKQFKSLKNLITEKIAWFTNVVLNFTGEPFITQSWVNCNSPSQYTHLHAHPNSIVSGCLYLEVNDNNGIIQFHKYNDNVNSSTLYALRPKSNDVPVNYSYAEIFQYHIKDIKVKSGDLVLFPSYLLHSVPMNNTRNDRWGLAFNSVTTKIGGNRDLTELSCN
jgi:uncharacterized protein (TIGR02466 family)